MHCAGDGGRGGRSGRDGGDGRRAGSPSCSKLNFQNIPLAILLPYYMERVPCTNPVFRERHSGEDRPRPLGGVAGLAGASGVPQGQSGRSRWPRTRPGARDGVIWLETGGAGESYMCGSLMRAGETDAGGQIQEMAEG